MRVVHYINQFFAGIGGEDKASTAPASREGAVGPGRKLASALAAEGHELVATVYCGDDYAASDRNAPAEILALAREAGAELLIAGPAFGSGRYGIACARVAAAASAAGIPALAAMDPSNPGLPEVAPAIAVNSGEAARHMGDALTKMAAAAAVLAKGGTPGEAEGVISGASAGARRNSVSPRTAAQRAVLLALSRLAGGEQTEIKLPDFGHVAPAAPIADPREALVAILTEGALVPAGNPDRLESARAKHWYRYPLTGRDTMAAGEFQSVHGGFSTVVANADPNRLLPLDVAREMEASGEIRALHPDYFVTAGNGTAVADATHFGVEWAAELRRAGVQAAILTAT
jgi:glycine reductase complex component B subunit gamma